MASEPEIEERMLNFFKQEKYRSLLATAAAQRRQSILVDHSDLISFDEELSHLIVNDPLKYLPILDRSAYKQLQVEDPDYAAALKEFKARVFNLPDRIPIREIRSHHLGKLIAVDGIMVRASTVRPMLKTAVFACSTCGAKYFSSEDSPAPRLKTPERCERCRGRKFEMIPEESEYMDFQLVGIQEKPEDLPPGQIPRVIDVELKGDIVDLARPGDRVIVTGILRTMPERDANTPRRTSKMYLEAVSIETASKEPESLIITPEEEKLFREMARDPEIHKKLVESIAPSLYGLEHVKKAVMLLLFGGTPKQYPDGTKIRGDIHLLLVGDPGTGKSQLLKYVAMMAPRGIYTSGRGSTAAGLCVSGDTLIYTDEGIIPIRDLVERNMMMGSQKLREGISIAKNPKIVKIIAPSEGFKKIDVHNAVQYYKLKAKRVIRITTVLGKSIALTDETPILCSEDGKNLRWKKASEVKVGEYVALAAKLPDLEGDWRKCFYDLVGDDVFIEIDPDKLNELLNKLSNKFGSLRTAAWSLGIPEDYLYYRWRRLLCLRLSDLKTILKELGMSFDEIIPYIKSVAYKSYRGAERVVIPPYPNEEFLEFLGDIYSDGCLIRDQRKKESYVIHYSSGSINDARNYVKRVRRLFGLNPKIEKDPREECYIVRFSNKIVARLLRAFGVPVGDKGINLAIHPIIHIMPRRLVGRFLRQLFTNDGGVISGKCVSLSTSSRILAEQVDMLLGKFGIISSIRRRSPSESRINNKLVRREQLYEVSIYDLESLKVFLREIGFSNPKKLRKLLDLIKARSGGHNNFKRLSDEIILVKVKSVTMEEVNEVYDLTVNDSHAFVANKFIVHNTAAVVRDSSGGMMLEAGALVLADMGVACIDEIDKMRPEDRVALHEAMAQQTISIAKGGIVATLNARTSILAAANPTLGRYDPYRSFTDNVDLPITILSRFDLIFVLRDEPNRDLDERLTDHVLGLQSRSVAVTSPPIKPEILRKYIAYGRRIRPELTPAAARLIKEFYLQMRSMYQQTSTVTITARQLESLIRLAEARARAALRDYVTEEDVLDVIDLMKRSLSEVGIDIETGRPDIDVILTGKPKSLRDKIAVFLDTLRELQEEKGHAEDEELREALREKGFTDAEISKILGRLLSEGKIFSPRTGIYRIT